MTAVLPWLHAAADISDRGLSIEHRASPAERNAVAAALGLVACISLEARYRVSGLSRGRYRLTGELRAECVQSCVVTLEPVGAVIEQAFAVEFCPPDDLTADAITFDALAEEADIEPLEDGRVPAGRIVYETLAAALDPYPRLPGAELAVTSAGPATAEGAGPFAALARLKPGRPDG
jgi:hypothetical protein